MHWYDGTIAEAVALSKQRNAIFVVFIEGENALSVEMATTINNADVLTRLADPSHFLMIKLKSGSENYTHFAQIYQFVPVPSLFFIGRNGTPLEVVCAGVQPNNLATRIDRILNQHLTDKPGVNPSTSSHDIKQKTADLLNSEASQPATAKPEPVKDLSIPETSSEPPKKVQKTSHVEITKSGAEYDVVCDGDVCTRVPRVSPGQAGPSAASHAVSEPQPATLEPKAATLESQPATQKPQPATQTVSKEPQSQQNLTQSPKPSANEQSSVEPHPSASDEKIEKAKELIEARRREKAAQEKELAIKKELERRAVGQGVTELKQWQAEQELKQLQEDRKREKMENNLARQRILEQIAQDRAERRARDQPTAQQVRAGALSPPTAGDSYNRARVQFKLPDGTSHTAHFEATGTLADLQTYVADNLQLSTSNFSLWTAFPRHELTEPTATLRNLQLTPSAALLVLPKRTPNTVASPSSFDHFIAFLTNFFNTIILTPSQQLYAWFLSLFNTATTPPPEPINRPPTEGARPPIDPRGGPDGLRRRGNVHRLDDEKSKDDDNNTWNGNSTQQM